MKRKTKKFLSLALGASIMLGLAACGAREEPKSDESEQVSVLDAYNQEITVRVNPKRVAILEPSALDILDAAG